LQVLDYEREVILVNWVVVLVLVTGFAGLALGFFCPGAAIARK